MCTKRRKGFSSRIFRAVVLQDDELARLLSFPNVLITSHQAFLTAEALREISRVTVENLRRFVSGQPFLEGTAL